MRKLALLIIFCLLFLILAYAQQDTTKVDSSNVTSTIDQTQSVTTVDQIAKGSSPSTNPNISVISDFQSSFKSNNRRKLEIYLNEAEFSFQSVIDPYARADLFLSFGKNQETGEFKADIEEGYLTTLDLPASLQLKVGKFRSNLGRLNPVHPHAIPFIDLPLAYQNYFGDGLNDEGFSLSWLVPNPLDFYQELTFEVTNGPTDNPSFKRSSASRYLYLAHLKNFWDISENSTFEFGLTGITGPNDSSLTTSIGAIDLTYKWKPLQFNTYQSFTWQSEVYYSKKYLSTEQKINSFGVYSFVTYQIDKRCFLTCRYDYANQPYSVSDRDRAVSSTLGWYATEFQKIELEGILKSSSYQSNSNQILFRWIYVIGSHGAHQY